MSGDAKQRRKAKREVGLQIANERRLRMEAEAVAFEATRIHDDLRARLARCDLDRVYLRNSRNDLLRQTKQQHAALLLALERADQGELAFAAVNQEVVAAHAALAIAEARIAELEAEDRDAAKLRRRLKTAHDELKAVHQENRNLRAQIKAEQPVISAEDLLARIS